MTDTDKNNPKKLINAPTIAEKPNFLLDIAKTLSEAQLCLSKVFNATMSKYMGLRFFDNLTKAMANLGASAIDWDYISKNGEDVYFKMLMKGEWLEGKEQ